MPHFEVRLYRDAEEYAFSVSQYIFNATFYVFTRLRVQIARYIYTSLTVPLPVTQPSCRN